jgi:light-regulated signal transduction histidine kinase (bacteriophytochrome)
VRHIALAHGGSVAVDSEFGRGSTFTLRLPLADAPSEVTSDALSGETASEVRAR